ncbi:MAG: rhomboid family intramembrane serine protease [Capnocytophaga sp.]|nr:rhomboid family intramembrane serine protease [Capnocytophaga sp.]
MSSIRLYFDRLSIAEKIILANVFLYLVFLIVTLFPGLSEAHVQSWVGLPQDAGLFVKRPWTLFTYFWFHGSGIHLFWNSVLLYFTGHIFLNLYSSKIFLRVYLMGALFGGIFFLLLGMLIPSLNENAILVGASGAIMCALIFVCTMVPRYSVSVFFALRVQLWHVASVMILFDLLQLTSSNTGGRIVHLSGALVGFVYAVYAKQPERFFVRNLFYKKIKKNDAISFSKTPSKTSLMTDEQRVKQHRVNQILEKISVSGYASLTDEEKKFLFQSSKEMHD